MSRSKKFYAHKLILDFNFVNSNPQRNEVGAFYCVTSDCVSNS